MILWLKLAVTVDVLFAGTFSGLCSNDVWQILSWWHTIYPVAVLIANGFLGHLCQEVEDQCHGAQGKHERRPEVVVKGLPGAQFNFSVA